MNDTENSIITFSSKAIAKNTVYNFLGYGIPLIFALVLIPPLIKGLGIERFGILNLAWIIIGYFSFFDFGIGKGLTKVIAEKIGLNQTKQLPEIFWSALMLMFAVSALIVFALLFFVPTIVGLFKISDNLHAEVLNTFYVLALSIPIVSTTAGLRGVLEAHQKFGTINIIRVFLGIFTFLIPLVCLILTNSLFWIVFSLVFIRIIIWIIYLLYCFKVNNDFKKQIKFDFDSIKPVLKFSAWITIANIIGPIILYSDRFLIGALISAAAITFYATPFEIVTKLLVIPSALSGVLFPVFSASFFSKPEVSKKILIRGIKFIFLIIYPSVFLLVTFSFEGMKLWLGENFAMHSSLVLQFLAIGILMNSLSLIPNNFFQGIGRPKIPTLINLVELPFYLIIMYLSVKFSGITGAAVAYMFAATADAIIMYTVANRIFNLKFDSNSTTLLIILIIMMLIIPFILNGIILKTIIAVVFLSSFCLIAWKHFFSDEEKSIVISNLKMIYLYTRSRKNFNSNEIYKS